VSFIPMVKGVGEDEWAGNGLYFPTAQEALDCAADLQSRRIGCKAGAENRRAEPSNEPVNARWDWVDGQVVHLEPRMSKQEQTRIEDKLKGSKENSGLGPETKWIGEHPLGAKS
jgi:hypothetical protein